MNRILSPNNNNSNSPKGYEAVPNSLINVRILDLKGKVYTIEIENTVTIAQLKCEIKNVADVGTELQRLIYCGRELENAKLITEYKITNGQTIHLFVRSNRTVVEEVERENSSDHGDGENDEDMENRIQLPENTYPVSDTTSAVVFPSDGMRRVDPLLMENELGESARRIKLWSSFILIVYVMKVLSQFALMADMESQRRMHVPMNETLVRNQRIGQGLDTPSFDEQPALSSLILGAHAFGMYVGLLGFKASHDTVVHQIRHYRFCIMWLAVFSISEQIYITHRVAHSGYPEKGDPYHQLPTLQDLVAGNMLEIGILSVMWTLAIVHAFQHVRQVVAYNGLSAASIINPIPSSSSVV